ncbi:MAG: 50S ribosomal protein L11 methyltransferase [Fretibacterium sp.]|nr:50S ribosomal protein L11 methyltransferase [Fretibacterium sp.]
MTLSDLSGAVGSELLEEGGPLTLRAAYRSSESEEDLRSRLGTLLKDFEGVSMSTFGKVKDRPWHTEHLEAFPPIEAGERFEVMAPWHREGRSPGARIPLYIYPASAFGTGYHESTRIALTLLEDAVEPKDLIVDVGTGTGVLFIAALKLGAGRAVARDLDPATLPEVRRNMELNGLPLDSCDLAVGDLLKGVEVRADLLMANILLEPNMALLPDVSRVLRPGGAAVFSGMTGEERDRFLSALTDAGLAPERELTLGDWWGCRARFSVGFSGNKQG